MAKDPDNLVLVMLREIPAKQDEHSGRFAAIETELADVKKQLGSMSKVVTYWLAKRLKLNFGRRNKSFGSTSFSTSSKSF